VGFSQPAYGRNADDNQAFITDGSK
jgi:hypothetical protein